MSTPAQAAANQANAQFSTGPSTDAGKQASSKNALKHGLTASTVLIPGEDPAAYEAFKQGLTAFWSPEGAGEIAFVNELISIQWRLKRCERLEAAILSGDVPDFKSLNNISLHESRLKRQYSATLKELAAMRHQRVVNTQEKIKQAALLRRADTAAGRKTDFAPFGFDFTVADIDRLIASQNAMEAAARATEPRSRRL